MTNSITVHVAEINGEPMLDSAGLALVFGVAVADVRALPYVNGASAIPSGWIKAGKRRTREALAHTGGSDLLNVLEYWANKDHNARIEFAYEEIA